MDIHQQATALQQIISAEASAAAESDYERIEETRANLEMEDLEAFMAGYNTAIAVAALILRNGMYEYVLDYNAGDLNGPLVDAVLKSEDPVTSVLFRFTKDVTTILATAYQEGQTIYDDTVREYIMSLVGDDFHDTDSCESALF